MIESESDFDALPRKVLGAKMPTSRTIHKTDAARKLDAELGSAALAAAIHRYQRRRVAE